MTKKIRIQDIAKALEVSPSAVSFALNNKIGVSSDLKNKIINYAVKIGYLRNNVSLKANYIAEVCAFYEGVVPINEGMTNILKKHDYFELRFTYYGNELQDSNKQQFSFDRILDEEGIKGIIVVFMNVSEIILSKIIKKNIPIVLIGSSSNMGISINIDDEHGGYIAAKYLLDLGHRKIGMILPDYWYDNVWNRRKAGYKKALEEAGVEYDIDLIESENTFSIEGSGQAAMNLIKRNPGMTAAIFVSDRQAFGGMKAMAKNGIKVPDEISVLGFDNSAFCDLFSPALTSLEMHFDKIGKMAAELVVQAIKNGSASHENIVLKPELVLRDSCRRI